MNKPTPPKTEAFRALAPPKERSEASRVVRRITRQPFAIIAFAWLAVIVLWAVFADVLAPYDPLQNNFTPDEVLQGPSAEHWLGTDENGRDVLSRIIFGARVALAVGFGSVLVAMLIGVPIGLLLGFRGGWSDRIGTRFVDIFDALPGMLVAFAVIAILGRGLPSLMLAIGLIFCMNFARMSRAITLSERSKLYIDAARVSGIRESAILFRQILPNLAGPLVIQAAILTGSAIIIESALSFLGIGLESAVPSWGGLLGVAAAKQAIQPFLAFPPGLVIIFTVLAFNMVGDAVNDALAGDQHKRIKPVRRSRRAGAAVASVVPATDPSPDAVVNPLPIWPEPVTDRDVEGEPDADRREPVRALPPLGVAPDRSSGDILEVRGLDVELRPASGPHVPLVRDVNLTIGRGEIVGLLGESGSGKSMLARSILGLLPPGIGVASGRILLNGEDIAGRGEKDLRAIRGTEIAAVFQDPMAALSPVHTVGKQLMEPLRVHLGLSKKQARVRAAELLDRVGVRDAANRLNDYPFQFSGGMAQRVAIAIALAAGPKLVIADEATSALDVTTQAQVLDLLLDLRDEFGMAILLITHDLGVVAEACDRVAVMYAGEIVEVAEVDRMFDGPRHPYTAALLAANPTTEAQVDRLPTIPGRVPLAGSWPTGCHFAGRCAFATDACSEGSVAFVDDVRCVRADELSKELVVR
ncbi:dipeptide/oligopeptide/nickel ABC transporter permease/ATP-binding protein [Agromyces allii]|uniref:Dipeptide/oligopeptide/nickel ABC transporter permease/ATP-binding protein n=1 Tax=Agromyces allii TaxID=393607 RepID=A0ABP5BC70_9MICO|nr:dipeptide/oligopeptide/nickel ABC transporter permease/ATP-binding protein [Agromyces allii]